MSHIRAVEWGGGGREGGREKEEEEEEQGSEERRGEDMGREWRGVDEIKREGSSVPRLWTPGIAFGGMMMIQTFRPLYMTLV